LRLYEHTSQTNPISEEVSELIARRFSALSEPMRIRMLDVLRQRGEASVSELSNLLGAGHANVSKHLNLLYSERIVSRRKHQTKVLYRITDPAILQLCDKVCGDLQNELRELGELLEPGSQ
jgi:DNA-binding transcriptional ArsR family regulator